MAGFDLDNQHSYVIPGGGRAESGKYSFCAEAYTVEVPTRLVTVYNWEANPAVDSNGKNLYTTAITSDASISAGGITFTRQSLRYDISQDFYYTVRGW